MISGITLDGVQSGCKEKKGYEMLQNVFAVDCISRRSYPRGMTDRQVLRNECERAMLQIENAFLKYIGTGEKWTTTASVADALRFDELLAGNGAAFSRFLADRLQNKGLVEKKDATLYGEWVKVRRKG